MDRAKKKDLCVTIGAKKAFNNIFFMFFFAVCVCYWLKMFRKVIIPAGHQSKRWWMLRNWKEQRKKTNSNRIRPEIICSMKKQLQSIFSVVMIRPIVVSPLLNKHVTFHCAKLNVLTIWNVHKRWKKQEKKIQRIKEKMRNYIIFHLIPFKMSDARQQSHAYAAGIITLSCLA